MTETPATARRWMREQEVAFRWGVRRAMVDIVARQAGVKGEMHGQAAGTYGPSSGYRLYDSQDVERVAKEIADGLRKIPPAFRTGTTAGRRAQRVDALWNLGCLVLLLSPLLVPIVYILLTSR